VNYEIYEVEWPWGHGQNDPEVYVNIWVGSGCSEAAPKPGSEATRAEIGNVCSLDDLDGFDVIVFKTCFTESGIDYATMQRYMENYDALGQEFDQRPEKGFIIWTLFPSLSGTVYDRQFSEWLRDVFAPAHANVYVWDVFEYMTYGSSNSLYSGYAWGDNHPTPTAGELLALGGLNAAGETVVGLGEFIVGAIGGGPGPTPTVTPTLTPTRTPLPTHTPTPTPTSTPTPTAPNTLTPTSTPSPTATSTPLPTDTPTFTPSNTPTPTPTGTPTPTATNTQTPTNTPSPTATSIPLPTDTPTFTPTSGHHHPQRERKPGGERHGPRHVERGH
jgi:hypothetical protein